VSDAGAGGHQGARKMIDIDLTAPCTAGIDDEARTDVRSAMPRKQWRVRLVPTPADIVASGTVTIDQLEGRKP
jgi:hypothetical protein